MPNPTNDYFAKHLKGIRESKGLSQSDLGKLTGLKPAAISHLETGQQKPAFETLVKLADALSVSMDYLFGRDARQTSSAADKLFRDFEKLSLEDQAVIQNMAKLLLKKPQ